MVEYALLIALVAIVSIFILLVLGPTINEMYCDISVSIGNDCDGMVAVTRSQYNSRRQEVQLDVQYDDGFDPDVTMTASPGGVMEQRGDHYHIKFTLAGCPCDITITSSEGDSTTVTVGP
jgi:Flp pilus assembly pilin Flp